MRRLGAVQSVQDPTGRGRARRGVLRDGGRPRSSRRTARHGHSSAGAPPMTWYRLRRPGPARRGTSHGWAQARHGRPAERGTHRAGRRTGPAPSGWSPAPAGFSGARAAPDRRRPSSRPAAVATPRIDRRGAASPVTSPRWWRRRGNAVAARVPVAGGSRACARGPARTRTRTVAGRATRSVRREGACPRQVPGALLTRQPDVAVNRRRSDKGYPAASKGPRTSRSRSGR